MPVVVRVVLTEREVVPDAVGETVPIVDTEAVVEGDPDTVGATVPLADSVAATVPVADKLTVLVGVPVDERVPTAEIEGEAVVDGDFVLVTEWLEELVVVAVRLAEIDPVADTETSAVRVAETDPVADSVATVVPVARGDSVA